MSSDTAERSVEFIANEPLYSDYDTLCFHFTGGEPLLQIELIEEITEMGLNKLEAGQHRWHNSFKVAITTNGILYDDPRVQRYIERYKNLLSVSVTLDGTRQKHDSQRVFADGRGSYGQVKRILPLWLQQFPGAGTKMTVSVDTLDLIADSVIEIWESGVTINSIALAHQPGWERADPSVLESQLKRLADYLVRNRLQCSKKHGLSFFSSLIGKPLPRDDGYGFCGAGKRYLAVDPLGKLYACSMLLPSIVGSRIDRSVGDCWRGLDTNRLRPYRIINRRDQCGSECLICSIANGCYWCPAINCDLSTFDSLFDKPVYQCDLHRAIASANRYLGELSKNQGATVTAGAGQPDLEAPSSIG